MNFAWQLTFQKSLLRENSQAGPGTNSANRPLFQLSAAGPRLTRRAFKGVAPDRRITFHKNTTLHLPAISRTFILLTSATRDQVNTESLREWEGGGQIHYLGLTQRHLVWLHLRSDPGITYSM